MIRKHIESKNSDAGNLEGTGAISFFKLDDIAVSRLGEVVDAESIVMLPIEQNMPVFPGFERRVDATLLMQISQCGKKWVTIVDAKIRPCMASNGNTFLRDALLSESAPEPVHYRHRSIVEDEDTPLVGMSPGFKIDAGHDTDDAIENDLILFYGAEQRAIIGTDIPGRLLRDIAKR